MALTPLTPETMAIVKRCHEQALHAAFPSGELSKSFGVQTSSRPPDFPTALRKAMLDELRGHTDRADVTRSYQWHRLREHATPNDFAQLIQEAKTIADKRQAAFCACNPTHPDCMPLWKAHAATDENRIIEGLASLDIRDAQNEIVHADRLDFEYLRQRGALNWHHGSDPGDQIGTIEDFKVGPVREIVPAKFHGRLKKYLDNIGLWVRAKLKRGLRKAEDAWLDMTTNPDNHGLGFSVHGSARRVDGHVVDGKVTAIALTHAPVLSETFATLAKALSTGYARSNQTGAPAMIREDLRPSIVNAAFGVSKYGQNPRGGYIGLADAVIGSKLKREPRTGRLTGSPVKAAVPMPAGDDVRFPVDIAAAQHALKEFLKFIRKRGPITASVLDGSRDFFRTIYGLDSRTASALAKYIREHADELFQKAFKTTFDEWFTTKDPAHQLLKSATVRRSPRPTRAYIRKEIRPMSFRIPLVSMDSSVAVLEKAVTEADAPAPVLTVAGEPDLLDVTDLVRDLSDAHGRCVATSFQNGRLNQTLAKSLDALSSALGQTNLAQPLRKGIVNEGDDVCPHCNHGPLVHGVSTCPMCHGAVNDAQSGGEPVADFTTTTPQHIARWRELVNSGKVPFQIALAVDAGRIPIPAALAIVDHQTDAQTMQSLMRDGKIPFDFALMMDKKGIPLQKALSLAGSVSAFANGPENVSGRWQAAQRAGRVPPSIGIAVDTGRMTIPEALRRIDVQSAVPDSFSRLT